MKAIEDVVVVKPQWYFGKPAEKWILLSTDVFALILAFYLAATYQLIVSGQSTGFLSEAWAHNINHAGAYLILATITVAFFWIKGHYSKRRPYWNEIREILKAVSILALVDAALVLFTNLPFSRSALVLNWVFAPFLMMLARGTVKRLLICSGGWIRPMVIVGWGDNLIETARAFEDEPLMGYRVAAFLIPEGKTKPPIRIQRTAKTNSSPACRSAATRNARSNTSAIPTSCWPWKKMASKNTRT